ncbi:MAG: VacB/RNase II family 3'-5' exoribonuclease [Planctomycetia bacterium]|nr:VacB/RNase II family 3'-5' exoribonuclease [Planctomycetia bacterium]
MNDAETRESILQWIARPQYVPVKAVLLAQQIGIIKEDFKDFQKLVRRMRKQGLLRVGPGHLIYPLPETMRSAGQIVGYFKRHAEGYGFVREILLHPDMESLGDDPDDIYIPPGKAQDAASGDFVAVALDRNSAAKGRGSFRGRGRSGAIERILERARHSFVGVYSEGSGDGWVEVDGKIFADPIRICDAKANLVKDGDQVVIEMLRFPSAWRCGEGVITEVLGARGDVKTETLAIIRQYNLPEHFSDAEIAEARRQVELFAQWESDNAALLGEQSGDLPESESENLGNSESADEKWSADGRRNLIDLYTITIDPADARDFDDAISIEALPNGNIRLAVHIADVSHFVQPDTQLDHTAYTRGNSVYLPDRVIPMLPEILSNGIASLQPNRIRFAKTVFQTFNSKGLCLDVEICDSLICSNARLNYEQVDRFFAGEKEGLPFEVESALSQFRILAKILRERRQKRGKLEMNLPEIRLVLDLDGNVVGVRQEENTESHQMIEEFMVSANEAVAQALVEADSNLMRRVHRPPTPLKLDALADFLESLGIFMDNSADRFELQRILEKTAGTPKEYAVHQAILRAMQRAEYSPEEEGHYALASDCYCHFTSPIRRYADLTIHRQIENYILGTSPKRNFRKIYDEGRHLSFCEQNAEEAERELTRIKMIRFFSSRNEMELEARIVGVVNYGFFVQCIDYPLSGLVSVRSLPPDRYRLNVRSQTLAGFHEGNAFRLGDKVRVQISNINPDRREISFELAGVKKSRLAEGRLEPNAPKSYVQLDEEVDFDEPLGSDEFADGFEDEYGGEFEAGSGHEAISYEKAVRRSRGRQKGGSDGASGRGSSGEHAPRKGKRPSANKSPKSRKARKGASRGKKRR